MRDLQKKQICKLRREGFGYIKIAKALNLSGNTVKSYCRRNNIVAGLATATDDLHHCYCKQCGKEIHQTPKRKPRIFCSDACRREFWRDNQDKIIRKSAEMVVCPVCGQTFKDYRNKHRKYCSHDCYIKARYKA